MNKGDFVSTPFGQGVVSLYRETDGVCVLELPYATLYAPTESVPEQQKRAMELNVAYEAMDRMRKLNLEHECQRLGVQNVNHNQCTTCLLTFRGKPRFPRIQKLREKRANLDGCLSCGSPVCSKHSSPQFRKEGIPVCVGCERLFHLDFIVDCMTCSPEARRDRVHHMMNVYDGVLLLLLYSMQFVDQVASRLQQKTRNQNHVSVGSSTVGVLSGVLGVAAAATILTPVGPPLLIASFLFGGSATAVQTSTEVRNYHSDSNRLANRIVALHGMVYSILRTADMLRNVLLRDCLLKGELDENDKLQDEQQEIIDDGRMVMTGTDVERRAPPQSEPSPRGRKAGFAGRTAEVGATAGLNSHLVAQTSTVAGHHAHMAATVGTGVMRVARVARFAGGALSAATMVMETKCMANTIRQIKAGNPCEKAEMLHQIKSEIADLPTTESLHQECVAFLDDMARREHPMTEDEVVRLLVDVSDLEEDDKNENELGQDDGTPDGEPPVPAVIESRGSEESESYKDDTQIVPPSLILERIKMHKKRNTTDKLGTDDSRDAIPIASLL